jgi:hypothetical protein
MDPVGLSTDPNHTKPTFACARCSDRKVKCNREVPCSACVRHRVQCVYRPQKAPRRKRNYAPNDLLLERLRHYEHLLQERGINPDQINHFEQAQHVEQGPTPATSEQNIGPAQSPTPASASSETRETVFKPEVIQGRSGTRLVDK